MASRAISRASSMVSPSVTTPGSAGRGQQSRPLPGHVQARRYRCMYRGAGTWGEYSTILFLRIGAPATTTNQVYSYWPSEPFGETDSWTVFGISAETRASSSWGELSRSTIHTERSAPPSFSQRAIPFANFSMLARIGCESLFCLLNDHIEISILLRQIHPL
jgi:hypothetical protein